VTGRKKPYRIHDEATLDLRLGARLYNKSRRGLGVEFVLAVDEAIAKIVAAPQRWPRFWGAQRYVLDRFPYSLFYRVSDGQVQILAVAHQSRSPTYWRNRR
jgi:plasmid stabilization system protein ParE